MLQPDGDRVGIPFSFSANPVPVRASSLFTLKAMLGYKIVLFLLDMHVSVVVFFLQGHVISLITLNLFNLSFQVFFI